MSKHAYIKIKSVALGFALGITWAAGILFVGFMSIYFDFYGHAFIDTMGSVYYGYQATFMGAIIGTIYAFCDGFISGIIFALIYNCCVKCMCRKCDKMK